MAHAATCAVIGGGLVGMSVALGLVRANLRVVLFDEGDLALRASRGNFGLIWVQAKGVKAGHYSLWTQKAARAWPEFARNLQELSGIDVAYVNDGGILVAMDDDELQNYNDILSNIAARDEDFAFTMLDHATMRQYLPGLGPTIPGGSFSPYDGHVNPLRLLHALHRGFIALGGEYRPHSPITIISGDVGDFRIPQGDQVVQASKIVFCAGLGNSRFAEFFDLATPIAPVHGQIMVSEPIAPCLRVPTNIIRQTDEGVIQIGYSQDNRGFDTEVAQDTSAIIARNALRIFPWLENLRLVRQWGALRIMPRDGLPIYGQSSTHKGVYTINCHSGVTLASLHATMVAEWIANDMPHPLIDAFSHRRFA
ncbi:MAG: FAD-binding oxidoreductase [Pseudomonadota bacterium]